MSDMKFTDTTVSDIDETMQAAWAAFFEYKKLPLSSRAKFMKAIAVELENAGDELIHTAMRESHLPEGRMRGERARTIFQLNSYADACEKGMWLSARINTAQKDATPPKPDLRKTLVPLGPVVVFGASNFPFAYSTAGGDTASAFAAGCPVIVKAHSAHAETSELVAKAIFAAVEKCGMPKGIFAHVRGAGHEVGKALVQHKHTKAVGFTGSYTGGKQLFDWGNQREEPIPVFAEMGSINPVFLLPKKLETDSESIAKQYAGSITLGVGQFCTNPGIIVGVDGEALQNFIKVLGSSINAVAPAPMLHHGIAEAFKKNKEKALGEKGVELIAQSAQAENEKQGIPAVATVSGANFLENKVLHQEVFGPYSLVIRCADMAEMTQVAKQLDGQLTATLMGTDEDISENSVLVGYIQNICGRMILNGVPTGVEVCLSQQHGGPFPASTDSRFGAVGADAIKRFARPLAYQDWSNALLPDEIKNENPLGIWRTVNDKLTMDSV